MLTDFTEATFVFKIKATKLYRALQIFSKLAIDVYRIRLIRVGQPESHETAFVEMRHKKKKC